MKIERLAVTAVALAAALVCLPLTPGRAPAHRARMAPLVKLGPKATAVSVVGANYGVFACQIVGQNQGQDCYDPYQIRHAYQIDPLISTASMGAARRLSLSMPFSRRILWRN